MTAEELLRGHRGQTGLRTLLRKMHFDDTYAIILVGTNDLGRGGTPQELYSSILGMHQVAAAEGAKTFAITIPSSGACAHYDDMNRLRLEVNRMLRDRLPSDLESVVATVQFPLEWADGSALWEPDGLHLSAAGYAAVGRSLVDPVATELRKRAAEGHHDEG